jgi:RimJ/RimL family protein N-acetyltransferase
MRLTLTGTHVRLEPLELHHIPGLLKAAASAQTDPALYAWTFIPRTQSEAERYVDTAIEWREAGTAVPFATIRIADGTVIGSTRFWNLEHWAWPPGHPDSGRPFDACEIGYTWLTGSAIRTAANTEAKTLMLTHAFETWRVLRVCLHTDARNARSRAAIARIGGRFEGILRAHRLAADNTPRDSARFSILADEWPTVKRQTPSGVQY